MSATETRPKSILFVAAADPKQIGGHFISLMTLANQLQEIGYRVGFMVSPLENPIVEFQNTAVEMFYEPYYSFKRGLINRTLAILRILKTKHYDCLVAGDCHSAYQAMLGVVLYKTPMVQIVAGGTGPTPLVNLPGIVVFSQELYLRLPAKHQIFPEYIIVNGGQVDFAHFNNCQHDNMENLGFDPAGGPRILTISRLDGDKGLAIKALLDNVAQASQDSPLQCFIIGSGPLRAELEAYGTQISRNANGLVDIRFLGAMRVTSNHLRQADFVVGQGRTVVEGIASGVPSAVCGKDGYFGLIRPSNFHAFALTNFTGRQLEAFSDLRTDLKLRQMYLETEIKTTYKLAYEHYDVSSGANAILNAFDKHIQLGLSRSKLFFAFMDAWRKYFLFWLAEKRRKR